MTIVYIYQTIFWLLPSCAFSTHPFLQIFNLVVTFKKYRKEVSKSVEITGKWLHRKPMQQINVNKWWRTDIGSCNINLMKLSKKNFHFWVCSLSPSFRLSVRQFLDGLSTFSPVWSVVCLGSAHSLSVASARIMFVQLFWEAHVRPLRLTQGGFTRT